MYRVIYRFSVCACSVLFFPNIHPIALNYQSTLTALKVCFIHCVGLLAGSFSPQMHGLQVFCMVALIICFPLIVSLYSISELLLVRCWTSRKDPLSHLFLPSFFAFFVYSLGDFFNFSFQLMSYFFVVYYFSFPRSLLLLRMFPYYGILCLFQKCNSFFSLWILLIGFFKL